MSINYQNLEKINNLIDKNKNVKLLIVTKKRSEQLINELILKGYRNFGENKVQEALNKFQKLIFTNPDLEIDLIGPLQTNKVKPALKVFKTIQSLDRPKLAETIHKQLSNLEKPVTKFFYIQLNIGNEPQKSGISTNEVVDFYHYCLSLKINIKGLMCIPPNVTDPSEYFDEMVNIKNKLNNKLLLSMGMSNDYPIAIQKGSNLIRVGSHIFD